jgi:hypothetical protein
MRSIRDRRFLLQIDLSTRGSRFGRISNNIMKILETLLIALVLTGLAIGCSSTRDMDEQVNAGETKPPAWGAWEPWTGPGWLAKQ